MKKSLVTFLIIALAVLQLQAQTGKAIRIGYIDMEFILQNVPDYAEANNQLEQKAQKWKQELEAKKSEIVKLKDALKTEKVLLTKELIEEREEAIIFLEVELVEFQQKRFGPTGDYVVQKEMLVKPVQDQIFNAVQDIAERRKYDFIFDKSSNLTMLFAIKRYDISDQVIRSITRAGKAEQRTKKQIKEDAKKEYQEDLEDINPGIADKKKAFEERKKILEQKNKEKREALQASRDAAEARKKQILEDRAAKKAGIVSSKTTNPADKDKGVDGKLQNDGDAQKSAIEEAKLAKESARKELLDNKQKDFEERKKAIEDRKAKTIADREAAKKIRELQKQKNDSLLKAKIKNKN
jgi:Skp family chaperone for outer membrane proteins